MVFARSLVYFVALALAGTVLAAPQVDTTTTTAATDSATLSATQSPPISETSSLPTFSLSTTIISSSTESS